MDAQIEFKVRPDHAAACNKVFRDLTMAPKGKLSLYTDIAKRTGEDWHTVVACVRQYLGKPMDGVLSRTTSDGHDIIFVDPPACDTLIDAGLKAEMEGRPKLAGEIRDLQFEFC